MDPSQIQSDKANDVHSLESGGEAPDTVQPSASDKPKETLTDDGKTKITDASGEAPSSKPGKSTKEGSFISKLWKKFNIYLVLFGLVVTIAVGLLVILTVKAKQTAQVSLNPQGLSQDALKQLASSDVTVGDAKQILTVQSNAVFAGSVLVRSNMEVAGTLKVGGSLSLPELTVTGATQLNDVTANNLTVNSNLNLQGILSAKKGLSVTGNSNITGNLTTTSLITGGLQLNGDLNLTHHITAGGTTPDVSKGAAVGSGGTVSLSGSDTGGSVVINTGTSPPGSGGCFATVKFTQTFASTPHVVITPVGAAAAELTYYITRSTTGFVICSTTGAPGNQTFGFDYIVFA